MEAALAGQLDFRCTVGGGTGVEGATIRLYLEKYEPPSGKLDESAFPFSKEILTMHLQATGLNNVTCLHGKPSAEEAVSGT